MKLMRVASIALAAYFVSSALAHVGDDQALVVALERRVQGHASAGRRWVFGADDDTVGRMKSSTAAPSFRNSGLDTTLKGCDTAFGQFVGDAACTLSAGADRHRALVDDDLVVGHQPGRCRGRGQHVLRSAEPSSPGGVPTAMNWIVPCGRPSRYRS
jgi:hypothetical protein